LYARLNKTLYRSKREKEEERRERGGKRGKETKRRGRKREGKCILVVSKDEPPSPNKSRGMIERIQLKFERIFEEVIVKILFSIFDFVSFEVPYFIHNAGKQIPKLERMQDYAELEMTGLKSVNPARYKLNVRLSKCT
jgi:hypothetical protein